MLACDFFTVDTAFATRLCVLFFIELGSRRVHVAGCTQHPSDAWVAQQARQLSWSLADRASPPRLLIHDRDSKFTGAFDEIFRSEGIEIVRTPIQAPQANAFAERFVGTVRRECLDWILITDRRQLERVLHTHVDHHNSHRPHRGLGLVAPQPRPALRLAAPGDPLRIHRRDRLGGLIHEYTAAAYAPHKLLDPRERRDRAAPDALRRQPAEDGPRPLAWQRAARAAPLDEPTQRMDVGARADIYEHPNAATQQGLGMLLVSSDFEAAPGSRRAAHTRGRGPDATQPIGHLSFQ